MVRWSRARPATTGLEAVGGPDLARSGRRGVGGSAPVGRGLGIRQRGSHRGEVSLALLDDPAIRELNRAYLSRDWPSDVIAFTLHDEGEPVLGDIYIGHEQVVRQGP